MTFEEIRNAVNSAWRDHVVNGVPATGPNEPVKQEIRAALLKMTVAMENGGFSAPPNWAADLADVQSKLDDVDAVVAGLGTVSAKALEAQAAASAAVAARDDAVAIYGSIEAVEAAAATATDAIDQMLEIASGAPDAPSILNKANRNGSNVEAEAFRRAIGAATPTFVNVRDFGAKGDGVTNDTEAFNLAFAAGGGVVVFAPPGRYLLTPQDDSYGLSIPDGSGGLMGSAGATVIEFITNPTDAPSTSVTWDTILISGVRPRPTLLADFEIAGNGGRRNNAAAVAVRNGATRVDIRSIVVSDAIGSAIVIEGNVGAPYSAYCSVRGCRIKGGGRHGVYLSGVNFVVVADNWLEATGLESIVYRNCSDIVIERNTIIGDGVAAPTHGIAPAQPPSGVYSMRRVVIRGNRGENIPGALFYGQGLGVIHEDSDLSDNDAVNCMQVGSSHAFMLYRWSSSRINGNRVYGGRNRGFNFYGCTSSSIRDNIVRDVNSAASSIGAFVFTDYADPRDGTTTYSTDNDIDGNLAVDTRTIRRHTYGFQFLAGSNKNRIGSRNRSIGHTSRPVHSADAMTTQHVAVGETHRFVRDNVSTGSLTATAMSAVGETAASISSCAGYLKRFVLRTFGGSLISGEIICQLFKNGSSFYNATLTGDGATSQAIVHHDLFTRTFEPGDMFTAQITVNGGVVSAPTDVLFQIETASW